MFRHTDAGTNGNWPVVTDTILNFDGDNVSMCKTRLQTYIRKEIKSTSEEVHTHAKITSLAQIKVLRTTS